MSAWMITDAHADFLATAYLQFIAPAADPQAIGAELLAENARSLRARYEDRHGMAADGEAQAAAYRYTPWRGNIEPGNCNKQARCADYQCCEHGEAWAASASAQRIAALIAATGGYDAPMSDDDPWGIDEHPASGRASLSWQPIAGETVHLRKGNGLGLAAGRYTLEALPRLHRKDWRVTDHRTACATAYTEDLTTLEARGILTPIAADEAERERERLALRAAAPKRADVRALAIVEQDDCSALALFQHADEPRFTFH